jgi:uncharacterized protein with HEPN domain
MTHRDIQLLKKIVSECDDIVWYSNDISRGEFMENDVYQKAMAMSLLNIGEHANVLTKEVWLIDEAIQWRKIVDLRNIVAHGYGELKMELVWNLALNEIPILKEQIESMLT